MLRKKQLVTIKRRIVNEKTNELNQYKDIV